MQTHSNIQTNNQLANVSFVPNKNKPSMDKRLGDLLKNKLQGRSTTGYRNALSKQMLDME